MVSQCGYCFRVSRLANIRVWSRATVVTKKMNIVQQILQLPPNKYSRFLPKWAAQTRRAQAHEIPSVVGLVIGVHDHHNAQARHKGTLVDPRHLQAEKRQHKGYSWPG